MQISPSNHHALLYKPQICHRAGIIHKLRTGCKSLCPITYLSPNSMDRDWKVLPLWASKAQPWNHAGRLGGILLHF